MSKATKRAMPVGFLQRLNGLIHEHTNGNLRRFALGAGINQQTLFAITRGTIPGADIICKVCKTYGVSADYLLFGDTPPK